MRAFFWSALIIYLYSTVTIFTNDSNLNDLKYTNENLAFSLILNSVNQEFLKGEALESINRDAIVGVVDKKNKFYSLIIVTKAENLAVEEFARVTLEELPIAEKKIHSFEKNPIDGNPSVSATFQGQIDNYLINYQIDFIYFKDIIYQHVNFKISDGDKFEIQVNKPTFKLLRNLVPKLASIDESNLNFGLTWYLDDKEYAHLGYRFKLPSEVSGFRTLWGEKAQFFHPEALVGYEADDGRRSIYVIATNDHDDLDSFINYWKKSFADSNALQKVNTKSSDYAILDFNSAEQVLRYQIRFERGNHGSVALIQFSRPMDNLPFPASLLVGFKWIQGKEYNDTIRILRSPRYGRLLIGDQESFYQNTYNNYGQGVSWEFPVKDVVEAGFQQDGHVEGEYSLYVENYSQKYFATLQIQEDQFLDSLKYHKDNLPQASKVKTLPTKQKLGFYYTPFTVEGQNYNYLYITKKHKDTYIKSLIWSRNLLNPDKFLNQIKFTDITALNLNSETINHNGLGFSIEKPKDYRFRLVTPSEIAPIGEVIQLLSSLTEHELYVIKSALMDEDVMLDLYLRNKKPEIRIVPGEVSTQKYIGLNVSQRKFTIPLGDRPKILVQRTLRRGDTVFSSFSLLDPTIQDKSVFFELVKLKFDRKGWIE